MQLTGPQIILTLKVLVCLVSVIYAAAIACILLGLRRWHGRLNTVFFGLTMTTVFGFELLLRLGTDVTAQFSDTAKAALRVHLYFSIPAAVLLPIMLFSGIKHYRNWHIGLGIIFTLLWMGTFITGVFFLPHSG